MCTPRWVIEEREKKHLHEKATSSTDERYTARRHSYKLDEIRPEFQRDYTRIIHCRAFRRLRHKTQVFISPKNDHLCTRMEHSIYVASVSQTIARALRLNEDLVAAIAMGHDLGHAPFGHEGERTLNKLAQGVGLRFEHELHGLRVVDFVERMYPNQNGLNLTFAVRDGIVCHYGEGFEKELSPDRSKGPDYKLSKTVKGQSRPATLEGCVVRWADKVAYLGRDLEDAIEAEIVLSESDLPPNVRRTLGISDKQTINKQIINTLVNELHSRSSVEEDRLAVGDDVHGALNELYAFSMERVYKSPQVMRHFVQVKRAVNVMFEFLLKQLKDCQGDIERLAHSGTSCREKDESGSAMGVFVEFLRDDIGNWQGERPEQLVIDFIAGMTDSFFNEAFSQFFLPKSTV